MHRHWPGFHIIILLYFLYVLPKRLGFGTVPHGVMVEVDAAIDIVIVVDIVINFRAYYFDKRHILVTQVAIHPLPLSSTKFRSGCISWH